MLKGPFLRCLIIIGKKDIKMINPKLHIVLLGDVGGTNIRLELVSVDTSQDIPIETLKKDNLKVERYDQFQSAIEDFLNGAAAYPEVAVVGMAGPIFDNRVKLANVEKWGLLTGQDLGAALKIPHFRFINDFEAASYGLLLVPESEFVSLNGLQANPNRMRSIIGPGTGLGNSQLYPAVVKNHKQTLVLPCEGGHTDFPTIDQETADFFAFMQKQTGIEYISLERSFCGPAIPTMHRFVSQRFPEDPLPKEKELTSELIVARGVEEGASRADDAAVSLLVKIYSAAIANHIVHHMSTGGLYLVGSITNSLLPRLKDKDILAAFRKRHPQVASVVEKTPLLVCKEIDLGLKGAFFVARTILLE